MKIFNRDQFQVVPVKFGNSDIRYLEPMKEMEIRSETDIKNWDSIKKFLTIIREPEKKAIPVPPDLPPAIKGIFGKSKSK